VCPSTTYNIVTPSLHAWCNRVNPVKADADPVVLWLGMERHRSTLIINANIYFVCGRGTVLA